MTSGASRAAVLVVLLASAAPAAVAPEAARAPRALLQGPPIARDPRPWTRWWWLGSAVDEGNLTRQLEGLAAAGFGGVEICPIYGVAGREDRDVPFLSPRFMELLAHTTREANRLGLGVDFTTGTGWPFGGPSVTGEDAASALVVEKDVPAPGGSPTPYVARLRGTGQRVKRAAPGGEGLVLDPYSEEALARYLRVFDGAFDAAPRVALRAQFHDSFEYYGASGTRDALADLAARRGIDPAQALPALAGAGDADTVARVKGDYRRVLAERHRAYVRRWTAWSHARGQLSRNQAHGSPANLLDVYAAADIPETEVFGAPDEKQVARLELAASAAHLAGRPLVAAEAFTWLGEHFQVPPWRVKEAADWLFLAGVNHLVFHGVPYSPADALWPGWQFYASVNFGEMGGLWSALPGLNAYLTRCQEALQSGAPDADVLLLLSPDDVWDADGELLLQNPVPVAFDETGHDLWRRGYAWDAVSAAFLATARVERGRVRLGDGRYRAILVPRAVRMEPEALQRLLRLARDGATVLFLGGPPTDVPGFGRLEARRAELRLSLATVPSGASARGGAALGRGRVLIGPDAAALLEAARVPREPMVDRGLQFVRRASAGGRLYFVVNRGAAPVDGWVPLATPARRVGRTDPLRAGRHGDVPVRRGGGGDVEVRLELEPGESTILRTALEDLGRGPLWPELAASGPPSTLDGTWSVRFIDGGPALPRPFEARTLLSWTGHDDPEAARFSGTARYTLEFELPSGRADDWQLDLGRVADFASVAVNGRPVANAWTRPFRVLLGPLPAGRAALAIDVTNLAANRVRDLDVRAVPWKIFRDANVVGVDYRPLDASRWAVREAGLLGPVTLQPLVYARPRDARK